MATQALKRLLAPKYLDHYEKCLAFLATEPIFRQNRHMTDLSLEQQRALTVQQLKAWMSSGLYTYLEEEEHPVRCAVALECMYFHNCSFATKVGST